jgi:hypothetical protein
MRGTPNTDAGFKTNRSPWFRQLRLPNRIIFLGPGMSALDFVVLQSWRPLRRTGDAVDLCANLIDPD